MPYKEDENGLRVTNGYSIKRFWGVHREIIRLHALGTHTGKDIADALGIAPQTVYNVLGLPEAEVELERYQKLRERGFQEVQEQLAELAPIALDIIEQDMTDPTTPKSLRTKLANQILDRVGHNPIQKVSVQQLNATVTPEFLSAVKERAKELKEQKSQAMDVEFVVQEDSVNVNKENINVQS